MYSHQDLCYLHTDFLEFLRFEKQRATRTIRTYSKNFTYFIKWLGENDYPSSIESLQAEIIKAYMYSMYENDLKAATVRLRMVALNCFLEYLVNWEHIEKNPIKGKLYYPSKSNSVHNYITIDEVMNFINVPVGLYKETSHEKYFQGAVMLRTFFYTGVRRAGLVGLNWEDIDLKSCLMFVKMKGGELKKIPIPEKLKKWFSALKKLRNASEGPVFVGSRLKRRITVTKLVEEFKYYYKLAGINRPFRIHDMRHKCINYLLEKGMQIHQVQEIVGHKDIHSTLVYVHQDMRKLKKGMDLAFSKIE
jgi:site-specific recombinase XerD